MIGCGGVSLVVFAGAWIAQHGTERSITFQGPGDNTYKYGDAAQQNEDVKFEDAWTITMEEKSKLVNLPVMGKSGNVKMLYNATSPSQIFLEAQTPKLTQLATQACDSRLTAYWDYKSCGPRGD